MANEFTVEGRLVSRKQLHDEILMQHLLIEELHRKWEKPMYRRMPWNGKHEPVRKDNKKIEDKRISTCQECRYGIFEGTEYVYTNTGYRHTGCVNEGQLAS